MTTDDQAMTFEQSVQAAIELDAPLNERLAVVAAAVRRLNSEFADAVERLVDRLEKQGAGTMAPAPGEAMPGFLLPDDDGKLVSLSKILSRGPAVITFQRGHWCPYCRLNAIGIVEVQREIAELGGQVVVIMPERRKFAKDMKAAVGAQFPFLVDMDNGYALSLNLAIWVGAEMERLMGLGLDLPNYQGNSSWFLPIPATFIVGTNGIIADRFVDPDYRRRMDIDEMIAALRRAR
ncbi:peroxiredoxin-like family protein [Mesorhizobium sp. M4B.F.Ca.ET.017.02.2.1]|uniref:peroxiredoxin-like family protein n=1 Tax=Mesorhizobium sp. M4B.F.Ca.ET.017.02.2.1 TaxID=2496649 RepID=UPI000FCC9950|nr:peroxiredoxin-like family protein [Mesorhizobium sp. M4B.F.Ca.ET.017.02.2.1]RVD29045.1 AhpC/TSA family protein [Mesorhizobium sp. M4B.F.Ca.ET.017.02.2.1]